MFDSVSKKHAHVHKFRSMSEYRNEFENVLCPPFTIKKQKYVSAKKQYAINKHIFFALSLPYFFSITVKRIPVFAWTFQKFSKSYKIYKIFYSLKFCLQGQIPLYNAMINLLFPYLPSSKLMVCFTRKNGYLRETEMTGYIIPFPRNYSIYPW